jgi:hypothetical protein
MCLIDSELLVLGINEDVLLHLLSKTKHKKGIPISCKLVYNNFTNRLENYCLRVELSNSFRSEVILHINSNKLKILNRDLKLKYLIDK